MIGWAAILNEPHPTQQAKSIRRKLAAMKTPLPRQAFETSLKRSRSGSARYGLVDSALESTGLVSRKQSRADNVVGEKDK